MPASSAPTRIERSCSPWPASRRLDFDLVNHTWFEFGRAANALESRERFGETTYRRRAAAWSPAYIAWLDALWAGNPVAMRTAAAALGVVGGIADTGESLRYRSGHPA